MKGNKFIKGLIIVVVVVIIALLLVVVALQNKEISKIRGEKVNQPVDVQSEEKVEEDNEPVKKIDTQKEYTEEEEAYYESKADIAEFYLQQKSQVKKIVNDTAKIDLYDDDVSWASWFETEAESTDLIKDNENIKGYKIKNYDSVKSRFTESGFQNLIEQYDTMIMEYNNEYYMLLDGMGSVPTYVTHKLIFVTKDDSKISLVDVLLYDKSYEESVSNIESEITTSTKFTTTSNEVVLVQENGEWKIDKYTVIW